MRQCGLSKREVALGLFLNTRAVVMSHFWFLSAGSVDENSLLSFSNSVVDCKICSGGRVNLIRDLRPRSIGHRSQSWGLSF
jgi:hypothetical protein